jgi:hypothetical protein
VANCTAPAVSRGLGIQIIPKPDTRASCLALTERVQIVEPLDKEQISQLLDDRERVGDGCCSAQRPA